MLEDVREKLMLEKDGCIDVGTLSRFSKKAYITLVVPFQSHFDELSRFVRFNACCRNVAIYVLCQAQNFGCQALSTILHPCVSNSSLTQQLEAGTLSLSSRRPRRTFLRLTSTSFMS